MEISDEEKRFLLTIARESIKREFSSGKIPKPDYEKYPTLKSKSGAFVTLQIKKRLRGCIGYIISDKNLYDTICDAAVQAAFADPRFPALTQEEIDKIELEISVLSEPFPMKNYDEIEIGKHGLILEELGRRALLLPQVPIEHNLDKDAFLSALCNKGGFPADYWKEKTLHISMFTATIFSEKELEIK